MTTATQRRKEMMHNIPKKEEVINQEVISVLTKYSKSTPSQRTQRRSRR